MTGTFHTFIRISLLAAIAASAPAQAAGPASAAKADKPRSCPKGQVELTSKVTGDRYCAAIGGISVIGGGPQPILIPEKPAKKSK
jgi:hypothetical protein